MSFLIPLFLSLCSKQNNLLYCPGNVHSLISRTYLCYMAKGTLSCRYNQGCSSGNFEMGIILDYMIMPKIILKMEKREEQAKVMKCVKVSTCHWWQWRWKKGVTGQVMHMDSRKANKWIIPRNLPKETQPCQHRDFNPKRLISDFWTLELKGKKSVLFSATK